jgi:transcriptional regulator with XRE-family HTH domain
MTQAQLAHKLGVSQAAIAKLERTGANPTVDTLDRALWATGHVLTLDAQSGAAGVDESLIRRQLELTPAERIEGIEVMHAQRHALASAGARSRGKRV